MSYQKLDIYKMAMDLAEKIHNLSFKLPNYELYETGSQIRRSAKSIPANIAEGYGRNKYKDEFIRFLIFAHSSCNETLTHLEILEKNYNLSEINYLKNRYNKLGGKINNFIKYVDLNWNKILTHNAKPITQN